MIVVAPTVAAGSVKELVALIKASPRDFSCGSSGIGGETARALAAAGAILEVALRVLFLPEAADGRAP